MQTTVPDNSSILHFSDSCLRISSYSTLKQVFSCSHSHLLNWPFGGSWLSGQQYSHSYQTCPSTLLHGLNFRKKQIKKTKQNTKKNTFCNFPSLSLHSGLTLFWKIVSLFPHHHRTFKKASAPRESRLCLCLLEGLFMLCILFSSALICSGFKVFRPVVSSPPRLCQSPILLSHVPPTAGVNLSPPPERNDWQVCGVNNIHSHNRSMEGEKKSFFSPQMTDKRTEKMSRGAEREDIIFIMTCLCGWSYMEFIIFGCLSPLPQLIFAPVSWYFHQILRNRSNKDAVSADLLPSLWEIAAHKKQNQSCHSGK